MGTWNVASLSGTEKDIDGWFVDGMGISEALSGLNLGEGNTGVIGSGNVEDVRSQENRSTIKASTLPKNDVSSLPSGDDVGLYVLGLQEIVDISSVTENLRPYSDPQPARRWKRAVAEALPKGYTAVAEHQMIGLFLIIYASPLIAPMISSVSTTSVGTGLGGYMGNKGAVTARVILGETTRMVFVNCHLAAGIEKGSLERRNSDAAQILSHTKFEPIYNGGGVMEEFGEGIGDEDFAFWFGDLNYRLDSLPGEDVRRLLMLHTQNLYKAGQAPKEKIESELREQASSELGDGSLEDDRSSSRTVSSSHTVTSKSSRSARSSYTLPDSEPVDPASDPASLQTTLSSLLPHDQLHIQMRTGKAFHDGWREGHIDFLPTYKYDVGSVGMFDSSEKRRGPSWCDRILYRTRKDRLDYQKKLQDEQEVKRRDQEMKERGIDESAVEDEAVLFDYDPDTDGAQDGYDPDEDDIMDSEVVITKSGFEDKIHLDYYTSHQRVLSSDHKPLDAIFTLTYDAVDPDLKMMVHQEVARELDKAENEGRPSVAVVVDPHHDPDDNERKIVSPESEGVNFGKVRYDRKKSRSITVANTGPVPATVGFVERSADQGHLGGIAPAWISMEFDRASDNDNANPNALKEYTLEPGDAANVEVVIHVTDIAQVRRLNDDVENLDDVLIFRVKNGRDYFIPVRGAWLQSAFGRSLDKLIRIPEGGVRWLQRQQPDGGSRGVEGVKWSAPRELFRLTESIEQLAERSIAEWGMKGEQGKPPWEDLGWPFTAWTGDENERQELKQSVREGLDNDCDFTADFPPETSSSQRLEAIAETLLAFVTSLDGGLITAEMWTAIEQRIIDHERTKQKPSTEDERASILEILSSAPAHSISFTFITFMLSRLANEIAPLKPTQPPPRTSKSRSSRELTPDPDAPRARRQDVDRAFAAVFADAMDAMVRAPATATAKEKEKERRASEARRRAVVEVFLSASWEAG